MKRIIAIVYSFALLVDDIDILCSRYQLEAFVLCMPLLSKIC